MKTIIRITNDYQSTQSYDDYKEEINQITSEIDVSCHLSNSNYINLVGEQSNAEFKNQTSFSATGYSQSDWQRYNLKYNCEENDPNLMQLITLLKRSFTHQHDYLAQKFEREEINGKNFDAEPHDFTGISIRDIEFPEKDDVQKAYNECYGKDYDELIIEID